MYAVASPAGPCVGQTIHGGRCEAYVCVLLGRRFSSLQSFNGSSFTAEEQQTAKGLFGGLEAALDAALVSTLLCRWMGIRALCSCDTNYPVLKWQMWCAGVHIELQVHPILPTLCLSAVVLKGQPKAQGIYNSS
jgi:hypothetical protein